MTINNTHNLIVYIFGISHFLHFVYIYICLYMSVCLFTEIYRQIWYSILLYHLQFNLLLQIWTWKNTQGIKWTNWLSFHSFILQASRKPSVFGEGNQVQPHVWEWSHYWLQPLLPPLPRTSGVQQRQRRGLHRLQQRGDTTHLWQQWTDQRGDQTNTAEKTLFNPARTGTCWVQNYWKREVCRCSCNRTQELYEWFDVLNWNKSSNLNPKTVSHWKKWRVHRYSEVLLIHPQFFCNTMFFFNCYHVSLQEIQDRIRIIELYAKDRQFADFVRQHQAWVLQSFGGFTNKKGI